MIPEGAEEGPSSRGAVGGALGNLSSLLGSQSPSSSRCSLLPTLDSDTDTLTLIHMLGDTHPDTHLHKHTHLRTQYTSQQHIAHTPRPERLPPHCLSLRRDLPRCPAPESMVHVWPLLISRAPLSTAQPSPSGIHSGPPSQPAPFPDSQSAQAHLCFSNNHLHFPSTHLQAHPPLPGRHSPTHTCSQSYNLLLLPTQHT